MVDLASTPILSQANDVGQGFDIFGPFSTKSLISPLVDYGQGGTQVFTFLGKEYLVSNLIKPVESTSANYNGGTYEHREDFQNKIATHAGVQLGYGAFSGSMQVDFASQFSRNAEYIYSFKTLYEQLATLTLEPVTENQLIAEFRNRISELPNQVDASNLQIFSDFFTDFGVYFTNRITLGASLGFYVSVETSSELDQKDLTASFEAQYNGLFVTGKIDAKFSDSKEWKTYSKSSQTNIRAIGGDPAKVAALIAVDPLDPSPDTLAKYTAWVASASSNPAVVDFSLKPIWELCGPKRNVVQEAWNLYGPLLHPRLTISTSAQRIVWPITTEPAPPIITARELITPAQPATSPAGWQVVVLDGTKPPSPASALLNKYYCVAKERVWYDAWNQMNNDIAKDLAEKQLTQPGNILIMASFGISWQMPPNHNTIAVMDLAGAGKNLEDWLKDAGAGGSQSGNWILVPCNYILVGILGYGPDTGMEAYAYTTNPEVIQSSLDLYLYRQNFTGSYTIGPAS